MIHSLLCVDPLRTVAAVSPVAGPVVAGFGKGRSQRIPTAVRGDPTGRSAGPVAAISVVATATWLCVTRFRAATAA